MENARSAALAALLHVDVEEGYSNIVLDKTLEACSLDQRDKALASAIFYGVLERRLTLNYIIGQFSKTPVEKMSPQVLEILRMGAYQILYLEKIPKSAAVNESVNLAKENKAAKASGFINAVLRSLIRNIDHIKMPDPETEPLKSLSVQYSCPEWLIRLWRESYGNDCMIGLLQSAFQKPPIFARVNNLSISEENLMKRLELEGIKAKSVPWLENAMELEQTGSISHCKSFQEGLFHIQDLSSQLCCFLFHPEPGERVMDVCSAPGGKAFTIAENMENQGELLAFDQYKGKVRLIRQGAQRLKLTIIDAAVRDASDPKTELAPADRVLCDVPCSGLGIIRRKPEIKYKSESAIDSLPDLQYRILCKSSKFVKDNGTLFYSTCTLNPKENFEVADKFLKNHDDFEPLPLHLPDAIHHAADEPAYQLTLMPHVHGTDGFFIAAFRKK
ncbi:16S rRNA (cytosine(967)-C(5))-methyltransferase RsmB [Caproiciproducens galactitolivorans]|uniref:16S rRNA (cytosine(967)-C(5))-methyltransferase n=1 Tax=Caproiciproducens galactitolivorans TaxID=642589 RepID=A0ABT4BWK0_9FIRM|nr:16S rRNA (cytosine(967)-C(5))-methyltransferase RsmB [Caproiciproducens galactitolivorans]MCY1714313.1 16S rRNA (cytosine(967)-C(5))-methyltransferase RsmB [Caproiciproducens galactitolivorans]